MHTSPTWKSGEFCSSPGRPDAPVQPCRVALYCSLTQGGVGVAFASRRFCAPPGVAQRWSSSSVDLPQRVLRPVSAPLSHRCNVSCGGAVPRSHSFIRDAPLSPCPQDRTGLPDRPIGQSASEEGVGPPSHAPLVTFEIVMRASHCRRPALSMSTAAR